jgi:hypothetical protein
MYVMWGPRVLQLSDFGDTELNMLQYVLFGDPVGDDAFAVSGIASASTCLFICICSCCSTLCP